MLEDLILNIAFTKLAFMPPLKEGDSSFGKKVMVGHPLGIGSVHDVSTAEGRRQMGNVLDSKTRWNTGLLGVSGGLAGAILGAQIGDKGNKAKSSLLGLGLGTGIGAGVGYLASEFENNLQKDLYGLNTPTDPTPTRDKTANALRYLTYTPAALLGLGVIGAGAKGVLYDNKADQAETNAFARTDSLFNKLDKGIDTVEDVVTGEKSFSDLPLAQQLMGGGVALGGLGYAGKKIYDEFKTRDS